MDMTAAAAVAAGANINDPNLALIGQFVHEDGKNWQYQFDPKSKTIKLVRVADDPKFVSLCASRTEMQANSTRKAK